jgi:Mce-associated membrane protein
MPVREVRHPRADAAGRRRVVRVREVRPVEPRLRVVGPPEPEESQPQQTQPDPPRRRRSRSASWRTESWWPAIGSRRWTVVVAVLLVAALAGVAVTGTRWYGQQRLDAAHQAALAAAKQTTVDFVTISADSVDRDLQRIAAGATGDFKDEFTRGMQQVRTAVVENKVSATGSVLRAGLVSGDLDSAVVLVAIDASVKNTGAPEGRVSHYRIQVDLALDPQSGHWLIARLQFVG